MPVKGDTALSLAEVVSSDGVKETEVTYTVGTDATTPADTYKNTVVYSITQ